MEIKATANRLPENDGRVKGLATLSFGRDIRVRSITIMEGKDGSLFVSMPSMKTGKKDREGNSEYSEICNPITRDFRNRMNEAILKSFEKGESVSFDDEKEGMIVISANAYDKSFGTKVGDARLFINDSFVISNIAVFESKSGNLYSTMPSYKTNKTDEKGKAIYQEMCSASKSFGSSLNKAIIDQFKERRHEREANKISIKDRITDAKEKIEKQTVPVPGEKTKETIFK